MEGVLVEEEDHGTEAQVPETKDRGISRVETLKALVSPD